MVRPSLNFAVGWKFYLALVGAGVIYYIKNYRQTSESEVLAGLIVCIVGTLFALLSVFLDKGLFRVLSLAALIFLVWALIHFAGAVASPLIRRRPSDIPEDLLLILPILW